MECRILSSTASHIKCGKNTWNVSARSPTCEVPHSEGREGGREAGAAGAHQIDPLLHPRKRRHIGRRGDDGFLELPPVLRKPHLRTEMGGREMGGGKRT